MTDINFNLSPNTINDLSIDTIGDLSPDVINDLFTNGTCLTFTPFESSAAWVHAMDKKHEFEKQTGKRAVMKSKTAIMPQGDFSKVFHFFSNGILMLATRSKKKIKNIKRAIELHGFEIKKTYGPKTFLEEMYFDQFFKMIDIRAQIQCPYKEDLLIEPLPDIKTFTEELFANNNVCLTASKNEMLNPKYRDYMALFANGRVIVSEEKTSHENIFGTLDVSKIENPDYVFLDRERVPHAYLEAIYQKAKDYDWYISKEEALENMPKQNISDEEMEQMNKYIDNLLKNRKCISITFPPGASEISASPDLHKYVLFSDGKLVVGKHSSTLFLNPYFPDLEIKEEEVPEYYIEHIYERLLSLQKSANTIFIEMLKQKAKKMKKLFDIPHHQALEIVAKISGLSSWAQITTLTERESRRGVFIEQEKKLGYKGYPKKLLESEYKEFLSNK